MNIVAAANNCAYVYHKGEHFKYVSGAYFAHPKAVSERMHTNEEKVVAFLHDVVENTVKKRLESRFGKAYSLKQEEACIQTVLRELRLYFRNRGCVIDELIPDIDILTKRVKSEKPYKVYIQDLIHYAGDKNNTRVIKVKLADLEDNSLPKRNPALEDRTPKDHDRLERYKIAHKVLSDAFPVSRYPEIRLRVRKEERNKYRTWGGRRRPTRGVQGQKLARLDL